MIAVKTADVRNGFKRVSDLVKSGEKVLVSRPRNENLVILSEEEYNDLERSRLYGTLLESLDQVERGEYVSHEEVMKTAQSLIQKARAKYSV
jgi:antitoxin YefM